MKNYKSKQPIPKHAKKVFTGELFDVWQWKQKLFDGSSRTFEKIKRKDTVIIIPVTKAGKIVVINQEQPGMKKKYCLPGGQIDKEESVLAAAKRELAEETGYKSDNFEVLGVEELNNYIEWFFYLILARDIKKEGNPKPDAGERIKPILLEPDDFIEKILSGEIKSKTATNFLTKSGLAKNVIKNKFKALIRQK